GYPPCRVRLSEDRGTARPARAASLDLRALRPAASGAGPEARPQRSVPEAGAAEPVERRTGFPGPEQPGRPHLLLGTPARVASGAPAGLFHVPLGPGALRRLGGPDGAPPLLLLSDPGRALGLHLERL